MEFNIEKRGYDPQEVDAYIKKLKAEHDATLGEQKQRNFELKKELVQAEKTIKTYKERSGVITKAITSAVQKAEEIEKVAQKRYYQEIAQLKAFHEKWMAYYNRILQKYPMDEDLASASRFNMQMKNILSKVDIDTLAGKTDELEQRFQTESARITKKPNEKRIGYITVTADQAEDDTAILKELIPDVDTSSPILSGNFDPVERINRYYSAERNQAKSTEEESVATASVKPVQKKQSPDSYSDRSELGFSITEALNPKEDLAQIMRDLGLLLDEN